MDLGLLYYEAKDFRKAREALKPLFLLIRAMHEHIMDWRL